MNFLQFLKSLDDLLYEIVTWLVFYPVTLWRTIRHPWAMMDYADEELGQTDEQQYTDTISPPLFLLMTLLLSHAVELAVLGQSSLVTRTDGLAGLITDDTTLLLMRLLVFSVFPLIMAVRLIRKQKVRLTRASLKQPFYAQCYLAGPFALLIGLGAIVSQLHWDHVNFGGYVLIAVALSWYGGFQARWFARNLCIPMLRAWWIGMIECVIAILLLAPLIA